jgi:alpha-ribazole phosphatase
MPTSRTIYLVRHTKPDIAKGICYGQSDIGVAASFSEESAITKAKLCSFENIAHLNSIPIVSSPLQRCFLLAKELHNQETMFEQNLHTDDRLKEMNFGDWELQEWSAIDEFVMSAWMRDYVNIRATNGESFREVVERSNKAIREIAEAENAHRSVIVVAHSGVIRAILAQHLEMPLHKAFSLEIDYGSISAIKWRPHYSSVLFVNR